MTKSTPQQRSREITAGMQRCAWCRHPVNSQTGPGRPKKFCSQRCRQSHWVAQQRASELALSEGELVVARTELDELKDLVFVLQCAVQDVRSDLASGTQTKDSLRELLEWLLDAAEPVTTASLGTPT